MGCKVMKRLIEEILNVHQLLDAFNSPKTESFWLKIAAGECYMPLSIERHGRQITITHYRFQNGDSIPDPDVELHVNPNDEWEPIAIQHSDGTYVRATIQNAESLDSFVGLWARNLRHQGFIQGQVTKLEIE